MKRPACGHSVNRMSLAVASSFGKSPRVLMILRSCVIRLSIAFVTGMISPVPRVPSAFARFDWIHRLDVPPPER